MTHTTREKQKLLNRIRRIRGQVDAMERAVETERSCEEVLHLIAGCRGAITGLLNEVMEDHIRSHFAPRDMPDGGGDDATEQLIEVMRSYWK